MKKLYQVILAVASFASVGLAAVVSGPQDYIRITNTLQNGATFYVSSGTIRNLNTTTIKFADGTTQTTASIGGGGGSGTTILVKDGGTNVVSSSTMNFTGAEFIITNSGGEALVKLDSSSATLKGNTFNTGTNLVQLSGGLIPNSLVDGSSVTKQGILVAGTNITLTPGAGSLTIASSGGGGGSSTLAVGTGTASNFTNNITSPTAAISFLGSQFVSLAIGSTNFINIKNSGVTAATYGSATQVSSVTVGADGRITGAANVTISLTNSNLQSGTYSNVTVPAANVASGSLGSSVIASSVAVNSVTDSGIVSISGSKITGTSSIPNSTIDGSSITKSGVLVAGSNITLTPGSGNTTISATSASPGGVNGSIQYKSGSSLGGSSNLQYDSVGSSVTLYGHLFASTATFGESSNYSDFPALRVFGVNNGVSPAVLVGYNNLSPSLDTGIGFMANLSGSLSSDIGIWYRPFSEGVAGINSRKAGFRFVDSSGDSYLGIGLNDSTVVGGPEIYKARSLKFFDADSSNWVGFKSSATVGTSVLWTLPNSDGSSGQALITNGAGNLSWNTISGGGGGTTIWTKLDGSALDNAVSTVNVTAPLTATSSPAGQVNIGVLSSSVTLKGNTFNTASNLLQLSGGLVPNSLVDGSSVTKQGVITAGSGISVTNGSGIVTIASTAGGITGSTTTISLTIDGQGSAIVAGSTRAVTIPYSCIISSWSVVADASGSLAVHLASSTFNNYPTITNITGGGNGPSLSSQSRRGSAVSGWTQTIVDPGSILAFVVDSASTVKWATIVLWVIR